MAVPLERIAAAFGTSEFDEVFAAEYPKVENISIDYAVLEPRSARGADSNIFCLPADFGWNDLGSWAALHEHSMEQGKSLGHGNVMEAIGSGLVMILDGRNINYTNIADIPEGNPISMENLKVHFCARGNGFRVAEREFVPHLGEHLTPVMTDVY